MLFRTKIKKSIYCFFCSIFLYFFSFSAHSIVVDIYPKGEKIFTLSLGNFYSDDEKLLDIGCTIANTILKDLNNSSLFYATFDEQISKQIHKGNLYSIIDTYDDGYEYLATGEIQEKKGKYSISLTVYNTANGNKITKVTYLVSQNSLLTSVPHKIADVIFYHITGNRGNFLSKILYVSQSKVHNFKNKKNPHKYKKKQDKKIILIDQDGADKHEITTNTLAMTPSYDKEGKRVIYVSYTEGNPTIYALNIENNESTKMFSDIEELKDSQVLSPNVSPDGKYLAFSVLKNGYANIYKYNIQKKILKKLTSSGINVSPSWSPDCSQIAYSSDITGKQNIYIMSSNGKQNHRITLNNGSYQEPSWSPDGRYIAFTKISSGVFNIGVICPNGKNEKILFSSYLAENPAWSPNSLEIIFSYKNNYPNPSKLKIVSLSGKELRDIETEEPALDPYWFAIT